MSKTAKKTKKAKPKEKKERVVHVSGKRKKAIARATIRNGKGTIRLNSQPLDIVQPRHVRLIVLEAVELAGDAAKEIDISVSTNGGGIMGQAEAAALSIAKGIVEWTGSEELKKTYDFYSHNLLVADSRQREPNKPGRSSARASAQKSKR